MEKEITCLKDECCDGVKTVLQDVIKEMNIIKESKEELDYFLTCVSTTINTDCDHLFEYVENLHETIEKLKRTLQNVVNEMS